MQIGRFIKSSLSAWKGKNSCVIEVRGSVLRSPFLTPAELFETEGPSIDESEIIEYISSGIGNLEAVVISGGEPLLQKDIYPFLKRIRSLKLPILLVTDGTCPDTLDDLLGACMMDKVTLKIAADPSDSPSFGRDILRTLEILGESETEYAVDIIAVPGIATKDSVESVCRKIKGKALVTLCGADPHLLENMSLKQFKKKEILEMVASARKFVKKVEVRSF